MFYLPEKLEIGQKLRAKLFFTSDPGLECIEVLTEVVWADIHFGKEGDYRCGVKFREISSEDLDKLRNFLESLSGLEAPSKISLKFLP